MISLPCVLSQSPLHLILGAKYCIEPFLFMRTFFGKNNKPLGPDSETKLRQTYRHLKVAIINKISMVGQKMLKFVCEWLKQTKQCQTPFGNISVLAVGDFFNPSYGG